MQADIATLRRQGLSVTAIARRTGLPPERIASRLGLMWDGADPIDRLAGEFREQRENATHERIVAFCERAITERLAQIERAAIAKWTGDNSQRIAANSPALTRSVLRRAADLCGTTVEAMSADGKAKSRDPVNVHARWVFVSVMCNRGMAKATAGRFVRLNHSSVIYGLRQCRKSPDLMAIVAHIEQLIDGRS